MVAPAIVYQYSVPEGEFKRYPVFHDRLADKGFSDELVRVGWSKRGEDGMCVCDRENVCFAEFRYIKNELQIIEYIASCDENHPWLRGGINL